MRVVRRSVLLGAACAALGSAACEQGGERPALNELTEDEAAASSGGMGAAPAVTSEEISLPFAVDNHFHDAGFMGAGVETDNQPSQLRRVPNDCGEREASAQGTCHCYDYLGGTAENDWAGLYWLAHFDDWGKLPGLPVEAGATRVTFRASTDPPGLPVEFFVGGIDATLQEEGARYRDNFSRDLFPELGREMSELEIELDGVTYEDGVLGGFGWAIHSAEPGKLCIDDIRWE